MHFDRAWVLLIDDAEYRLLQRFFEADNFSRYDADYDTFTERDIERFPAIVDYYRRACRKSFEVNRDKVRRAELARYRAMLLLKTLSTRLFPLAFL